MKFYPVLPITIIETQIAIVLLNFALWNKCEETMVLTPRSKPMPERSAPNPKDVADLFGWLDVKHLKYREFQLPDEVPTLDFRLACGAHGQKPALRGILQWPVKPSSRTDGHKIPKESALQCVTFTSRGAGWVVSFLVAMLAGWMRENEIRGGVRSYFAKESRDNLPHLWKR